MKIVRAVAAAAVTLCTWSAGAQSGLAPQPLARPAPPALTSAGLLKDAAILREAYEQLHPGLYRYNNKAEMDAHFAALNAKFAHDLSLQEAYLALSQFAAEVRCGHTYPNFFNQNKTVSAALFESQPRVPFYFRWLNRTMVVTEDFTPDHVLPRGTKVTAIDGVPTGGILDRLMTIARADGSNDAKRVAYLGISGDSTYEPFDIYFPMFFPMKSTGLQLQATRPGDTNSSVLTVKPLTFAERVAPIKAGEAQRNGGDGPLFQWKTLPSGADYLRMPTWAVYNSKWDWKTWLNTHLDELSDSHAPALVIDLRGNEGGNDVGDEILKRIATGDLKSASVGHLVRYLQTPPDLDPFLDTWDPSFKSWKSNAVELSTPWPTAPPVLYYALKTQGSNDPQVIQPGGKPYRGKIFVLIDANNSSATFEFAEIIQQNRLGTLVGQPTGGSKRGINGGSFFFLRLPNSGLEMDLPLVGTFPATPQPDAGLTPDVLVSPSLDDITQRRDPEMARVQALLQH
jgi:hypothetical protein